MCVVPHLPSHYSNLRLASLSVQTKHPTASSFTLGKTQDPYSARRLSYLRIPSCEAGTAARTTVRKDAPA
ncbi:uncharacterized protein B0H18DRAFT_338174 [Fomitopsis serialis]|uniref:uncharacterized protein n=1 Tax=Fomitopsis serialis TaxID=139415 RepID=UPI00200754E3|nr:uncharacterized protein B0H18DRAFT_338174 [Neoantrodia serialis]KAH9911651.1 hypothetical protein B0H18DRAFT_338174 [Neoantrodia serialis]